jgi:hypothetical protein
MDWTHHIFSKNVEKTDPLLQLLSKHGMYTREESTNKVRLPSTRADARARGIGLPAASISPHPGPLGSYEQAAKRGLREMVQNNPNLWSQAN